MKVLVACEFSGRVRDAFGERGHDAWSCDFEASETPGQHIQGDVRLILDHGWDMMIAHPPCTRLCNSGVRWLLERRLFQEMDIACSFFKLLLDCHIPKVAIENPVMHAYARLGIGGLKPDFTIQPWQFGDAQTKRTCFWTRNLPPLRPEVNIKPDSCRADVHREGPSSLRARNRSRTFPGIAKAMATQWGEL